MQPSLTWAIWALITPLSMAQRLVPHVKWEELMAATSEFPRYFGEVTHVKRIGPPEVVALALNDGRTEPMKCTWINHIWGCVLDCGSCATMAKGLNVATNMLQVDPLPAWNNLTFLADHWKRWSRKTDGDERWIESFFFNQTNLGGRIEIDNTYVQFDIPLNQENADGDKSGTSFDWVYTGEFDNGSSKPSCDQHKARDTAATYALKRPMWDALYPAKEYKLVYTVQDGRLYLTWRVTFDLKEEVDDDFIVWVNARNCSQIVAAASAKMNLYTKNLEEYRNQLVQLVKERDLPLKGDPAAQSNLAL